MNWKTQRAYQRLQHEHVARFPKALTPIPETEWPVLVPRPIKAWKSQQYLVQLYDEERGMKRMTIVGTKAGNVTWITRCHLLAPSLVAAS